LTRRQNGRQKALSICSARRPIDIDLPALGQGRFDLGNELVDRLRPGRQLVELGGDVLVDREKQAQAGFRVLLDLLAERPCLGMALLGQQGMELKLAFIDDVIHGFGRSADAQEAEQGAVAGSGGLLAGAGGGDGREQDR
jgi:hypothetical protein